MANLKPVPNDEPEEYQQKVYSRQVAQYKKPSQGRLPVPSKTEVRQEGLIIKRPNKQDLVHDYKKRAIVNKGEQVDLAEQVSGAVEYRGATRVVQTVKGIEKDLVDTAEPGTVYEAVANDVLIDSANRQRSFHNEAMQVLHSETMNIIQRDD